MFEITIDVVTMVGRTSTQSANVKVLRFSKNLRWSQFAYFELRKTQSGFSIPLDFEIAKVPCIYKPIISKFIKTCVEKLFYRSTCFELNVSI